MLTNQSSSDQIPNRFYVISMEFTLLKYRCLSKRNIPSNEEPGKMAVLRLFPETRPGPPSWVANDPRPCKKFTIFLTWDQALFSFHFLNKMPTGWAKKVLSFLSYFKTLSNSIGLVLGIEPQTAPPRPQSNIISYVQILLRLLGEILLAAL